VQATHGHTIRGGPQSGGIKNSDGRFAEDGVDGVRSYVSSFVPNSADTDSFSKTEAYAVCSILLQAHFRIKNWRGAYFLNGDSLSSCAPRKK
jgi:hypothetical protein